MTENSFYDSNFQVINSMSQAKMNSLKNSDGKIPELANQLIMTNEEDVNLSQMTIKELWKNPNPSSAFASQTITLSSSDYDYLLWIFGAHTSVPFYSGSVICPKGHTASLQGVGGLGGNATVFYRDCVYVNDVTYNCSDNIQCKGNATTTSVVNDRTIPTFIYGLKKSPAMIYTGKELFNDPVSAGVTRTGQHDTVSEYYVSSDGNTWYRKWASGWKECGGKIAKGISGQHKVTFPLTFSNTSFTLLKTLSWQFNEAVINRAYFGFQDITEGYAYTYSYTADGYDESWYACGY